MQQLVAFRGPRALALEDIVTARVGVSAYAAAQNGNVCPPDTMGAQFSIPSCAALALMGDPSDPAAYAGDAIDDPARRELARRIEVFVDPEMEAAYPKHYGARVELELAGGKRHAGAVLDPHGMPADPCSETELLDKFHRLAARVVSRERADEIVGKIRSAEKLRSARELGALLGNQARHSGERQNPF